MIIFSSYRWRQETKFTNGGDSTLGHVMVELNRRYGQGWKLQRNLNIDERPSIQSLILGTTFANSSSL